MTIGENINRLRGKTSQVELAKQVTGLTQADVSKWETNRAMPSVPNLIKLAQALQVSADALLVGLDETYDGIVAKLYGCGISELPDKLAARASVVPAQPEQPLQPLGAFPPELNDGEEVDPTHPASRLVHLFAQALDIAKDLRSWRPPAVARGSGPDLSARTRKRHTSARPRPTQKPRPTAKR